MYANAVGAYETVSKMTMSGREIEAAVLTKAARKLQTCRGSMGCGPSRRHVRRGFEIQPTHLEHFSE